MRGYIYIYVLVHIYVFFVYRFFGHKMFLLPFRWSESWSMPNQSDKKGVKIVSIKVHSSERGLWKGLPQNPSKYPAGHNDQKYEELFSQLHKLSI